MPASDLYVITSYFNPANFATKRKNFDLFLERLGDLNHLVVECSFGDIPFDLSPSPNILQVRAKDVMWQKERLLNVAIQHLPPTCAKVAWIDCDVLFTSPAWSIDATKLLDTYPVIQLFEEIIRLP